MSIRILLADNRRIILHILCTVLEKEPDMEVAGMAENGRSTVKMALDLMPDVVVVDINMPDLNGMETIREIRIERPDVKVLALSMYSDRHYVMEMLKAGALGYLVKTNPLNEFAQAVRTVAAGQSYMSPDIAGLLVDNRQNQDQEENAAAVSRLTQREREVFQLVAEGMKSREIAQRLNVSLKTIEAHRHGIMKKLKLRSISELTKLAIKEGLSSIDT